MNEQNEGATKVASTNSGDNCLGRGGAHAFAWRWELGVWTNLRECKNCGEVREMKETP